MSKIRVGIRVDVSLCIGTGHLMRMLALAQGFTAINVEVIFIINSQAAKLIYWYQGADVDLCRVPDGKIYDTAFLKRQLTEYQLSLIIFDGYHFPGSYIEACKMDNSAIVALVDDNNDFPLPQVDIVINHGLGAEALHYSNARLTLLGTQYCLLRREFDDGNHAKEAQSSLVTFGGTDPMGLTLSLVEYFEHSHPKYSVDILLGPGNSDADKIKRICNAIDGIIIVSPSSNMAATLAKYSKVVTAAGGTLYECRAMQCYTLAVVAADNQSRTAQAIPATWGWPKAVNALKGGRSTIVAKIDKFLSSTIKLSNHNTRFDTYGRIRLAQALIDYLVQGNK